MCRRVTRCYSVSRGLVYQIDVTAGNVIAMATEPEIRAAMQRLLGPVSPSWVAGQVGVTRQQVDRWKNGHYVTLRRLHQVSEAVRSLLPEHEETAAPAWAADMESRIVSEVRANRETLYARLADEAAGKALRLAGLLPTEPTDETPDQPPGSAGPSQGPTT
jgi:hypothetical protein